MLKKSLIATVAVFFALSAMDFVIHGVLLDSAYKATAHLWRPEVEMKVPLMFAVTFIFSAGLVAIYSLLINPKSFSAGLQYGVILGLASGASMGIGFYCYMPIPLELAISWFFANLVEVSVAGIIIGAIVKNSPTAAT